MRLGKAGTVAFTIQKLAGHSSITISQRYVHADRELKESAIRLLDALNVPKPQPSSDTIKKIRAGMAELADALALGASAERRAGSSPVPRTKMSHNFAMSVIGWLRQLSS